MRTLRVVIARLASFLWRRDSDREFSAELQSHLDMHIADNIRAGMTPEEARRQALIALGGIEQTKEHHRARRRLPAIDELLQDVRFAARLLSRERAFALGVVIVLAVGIAVNSTFFTLMNAMVLRGLPLDNVSRVADISARNAEGREQWMSYADFEDVKGSSKSFRAMAAFSSAPMSIADDRQAAERFDGAYVSAGALTLLGEVPVAGRDIRPEDDRGGAPPIVLVGRSLWQRRYDGRVSLIGESVRVNGLLATVVGIMPERSRFPTNAEVWMPLSQQAGLLDRKRDARNLSVFGWLSDGHTIGSADAEVRTIAERLQQQYPETNRGVRIEAIPVNEQYLGSATHPAWLAFITAGALVLLIACANVANLMLMRSIHRAREIAVRVSLGATRGRIVRQLLGESLVLAVAGGIAGLALSMAWTQGLTTLMPRETLPHWMLPTMDGRVLLTLAAVCLGSTLIFGLVPALHTSKTRLVGLLKEGGRGTGKGVRTRKLTTTLLVAQFALGMIFLAHVALTVRGVRATARQDPPIEMSRLLTASVSLSSLQYRTPADRLRFLRTLEARFQEIGEVSSVTVTDSLPLGGASSRSFEIDGHAAPTRDSAQSARTVTIGSNYFATLGVPLVRGRDFTARDGERGLEAAIVNQRLAETYFPHADPLGRRIRVRNDASPLAKSWLTIVGMSRDVRQNAVPEPEPVIYVPYQADPPTLFSLIVRGGSAADAVTPALRGAVRELDPDLPLYRVMTLDRAAAESDWNSRVSHLLITIITCIAIGLASVGLYAITAHALALRTQEVGVRIALGASPGHLIWLLLRSGIVQLAAGLSVGVAAVLAWSRIFPGNYGAARLTDVQGLAMAGAVLIFLGATACLIPAVRAVRLNPVAALRCE